MSSKSITLNSDKRDLTGRKVKQLRRNGLIPSNIFGNKIESLNLQVSVSDFNKAFSQAGETNIIMLNIKGEKKSRPVLISDIHQDPVTHDFLHVSFHQVDLKKVVTATVPVVTTGESAAVKEQGGVLVTNIQEIEVEALPTDLPDKIEIDVSSLTEIGQSIALSDLKLDLTKLSFELDPETPIVSIQAQQEEEPEEPEETDDVEEAETTVQGEDKEEDSADKEKDSPSDDSPDKKKE